MNTIGLLFQENPFVYIGLGIAAVALVVMFVFLIQFIVGKNRKRELIKFLIALFVLIASFGTFMYAALTVETPKSDTITAVMDEINGNSDYQKYDAEANRLTTAIINEWGVSGNISPEEGQTVVDSHCVEIDALIAKGNGYLKAIDQAAPKAKLDTLPKAYGNYVAAIKENIQISLNMLTDIQTVKVNQNEMVEKFNKEYNQALITAQTAINSAIDAVNKARGTGK
ncbi:hypothetical protein RyT2_13770 [Pseudolactococcus yaeyamensis]